MNSPVSAPTPPPHSSSIQHLVLVGGGPAHVATLRSLAQQRPAQLRVTVLGPTVDSPWADNLSPWLSGRQPEPTLLPWTTLVQASGAKLKPWSGGMLSAERSSLTLANGEVLGFDLLSVDLGPWLDRDTVEAAMPGARRHALWMYPLEGAQRLWPQVCALAPERPVHVVVIGPGLDALTLALACDRAFNHQSGRPTGSRVTWVNGGANPCADWPAPAQARLHTELKRRQITVIREACVGLDEGVVRLANGAQLLCDAPILAVQTTTARLWAHSGVALDEHGHPQCQPDGRTTNHPNILTWSADTHGPAGQWPLRLRMALGLVPPRPLPPRPPSRSHWLDLGDGQALLAWRQWAWASPLLGRWHQARLQRQLAALTPPASAAG